MLTTVIKRGLQLSKRAVSLLCLRCLPWQKHLHLINHNHNKPNLLKLPTLLDRQHNQLLCLSKNPNNRVVTVPRQIRLSWRLSRKNTKQWLKIKGTRSGNSPTSTTSWKISGASTTTSSCPMRWPNSETLLISLINSERNSVWNLIYYIRNFRKWMMLLWNLAEQLLYKDIMRVRIAELKWRLNRGRPTLSWASTKYQLKITARFPWNQPSSKKVNRNKARMLCSRVTSNSEVALETLSNGFHLTKHRQTCEV